VWTPLERRHAFFERNVRFREDPDIVAQALDLSAEADSRIFKALFNADKPFVDAGKARVDAGQVRVDAGKARVDAGQVRVDAGQVRVNASKPLLHDREAGG
jgi:hypothetical protein